MAKKTLPEKTERDPLSLFITKSNLWVQKYFKYISFALLAGILAIGLSFLYFYWQKKENKTASTLLYQAKKELAQAEQKAGGDTLSFDNTQNFFGQTKKAKYTAELNTQVNQYINLIKQWISKPAGLSAVAEMAYFLHQYGKHKEALSLLNIANPYKKKNLIGFLIAFQSGTYFMDQGEYEKAIKNFQFITKEKKAEWLWPDTLLKMALVYEKQNKTDQARKIYRRIKTDFSDSQISDIAMQYMNALNLLKKMNSPSNNKTTTGKDTHNTSGNIPSAKETETTEK